jgi:hypothetical protein
MKQLLPLICLTTSLSAGEYGDFYSNQGPFENSQPLIDEILFNVGYMSEEDRIYGTVAINRIFYADQTLRQKAGIELLYFEEEIDEFLDVDLRSPILAANYQLDFNLESNLRFNLGTGFGFHFLELDSDLGTLADDETIYGQVFGGVSYHFSDISAIRLGVRRQFFGNYQIDGIESKIPHQWSFELGFTARF